MYFAILQSGLGDRLLDICGLATLAKLTNSTCYFKWTMNQADRLYDINMFDFSSLNLICVDSNSEGHIEYPNKFTGNSLSPFYIYLWFKKQFSLEEISNIYIECAKKIIISMKIDECIPKEELKDCIGIHLRRTDKISDQNHVSHYHVYTTNDESQTLLNRLLTHIKECGHKKFFVCTDDNEYMKYFISQLPSDAQVITSDFSKLPNQIGADALYDMWCLSYCKCVLQNIKYSTYAQVACIKSQNILFNFSDFFKEGWLLLNYKPCMLINLNGVIWDHEINYNEIYMSQIPFLQYYPNSFYNFEGKKHIL